MNGITKKIGIGLLVMTLLSPLGILLPHLLKSGKAWGEWSVEEVEKKTGFVPDNMKKDAHIYNAPLKDYCQAEEKPKLTGKSVSYLISGIIGVGIIAAFTFVWFKISSRR